MTKQEPWFIEERAFAFTSLELTHHHNVTVRPYAGRDMGINLLAEILKNGKPTLRLLGAQLVGYLDLPSIQHANERVISQPRRGPFETSIPLCVFVVGVRKLEGIYRWVVEPIVDEGRAMLQTHVLTRREVQAQWRPMDETMAEHLFSQVNTYYDALNSGAIVKPRGRNSKVGA